MIWENPLTRSVTVAKLRADILRCTWRSTFLEQVNNIGQGYLEGVVRELLSFMKERDIELYEYLEETLEIELRSGYVDHTAPYATTITHAIHRMEESDYDDFEGWLLDYTERTKVAEKIS